MTAPVADQPGAAGQPEEHGEPEQPDQHQQPEQPDQPEQRDQHGEQPGELGRAEAVLGVLRAEPVNPHLLRGYGPLVAAAILALLMVLLLPTVARERVVERPVDAPATGAQP